MSETPAADAERTTPGGDPQHVHHDPRAAEPTPRDEAHRAALLALLTEFLGDDYFIATEKVSYGISLDLAVFAPSPQLPHPTLVTLGMSERPMLAAGSEDGYRLELLIGLPAGWPGIDPPNGELLEDSATYWPLRLLKDTARIPSLYDSSLDWGHSITNENGDRYDDSAPFTGALIGPPYGYPPEIMNVPTPTGGVQILAIFPATPEELALKVSVPSGGDMVLDRLAKAGVTAVIDPGRESVTPGPAPWHIQVLLTERAEHLGQVLDGVLPNFAAALGEQGIDEYVIPAGEEPLRWRVGGRIAPSAVEDDLALSTLPAREIAALREAVQSHGSVLTISPEQSGAGDAVTGAAAMTVMLVEAGKVAAVWLPHQNHLTLPAQFVADIENGLPTMCRVHPEILADGRAGVMTHGLTALGGAEVLFAEADLSPDHRTERLHHMLVKAAQRVAVVPVAERSTRLGSEKYMLHEGVHPDSGEAILEMVPVNRSSVSGRRRHRTR